MAFFGALGIRNVLPGSTKKATVTLLHASLPDRENVWSLWQRQRRNNLIHGQALQGSYLTDMHIAFGRV